MKTKQEKSMALVMVLCGEETRTMITYEVRSALRRFAADNGVPEAKVENDLKEFDRIVDHEEAKEVMTQICVSAIDECFSEAEITHMLKVLNNDPIVRKFFVPNAKLVRCIINTVYEHIKQKMVLHG